MKENKQSLMIEGILTFSTLVVLLYSYFNQANAFIIFASYAITIVVLGMAVSVYWYFKNKKRQIVELMRAKNFIDNISSNIIVWKDDLSIIMANTYLKKTLSVPESYQMDIKTLAELFSVESFSKEIIEKIASNAIGEHIFETPDGSKHYNIWNTSVFSEDKKQSKIFMSIGFDLTEIKEMQKKLYASENRYAISMELSEIGILLTQQGNNNYYISNQLQKMLGIKGNAISYKEFRRRIHPNDKILYDTYIKSMLSHPTQEHRNIHTLELRILSADGEYRWYLYRYKVDNILNMHKTAMGGAFMDITKDKEKDMLIEKMAYVDEITGIFNRNKLMITGQETYDCCVELNLSYWIIAIDIDRFHIVNDTCGYSNGNKVLKNFADIIYKYLSLGGVGARIGGDNFAIIIRDYGDEELPIRTVEKIQNDFEDLATDIFSSQSFSCSAGYSKMPDDGDCFAVILDHAEFALSSGEKNRSTIIPYDHYLHDKIIDGSEIKRALADAIEHNQLCLFYQPKIDLKTGKIMGVEALIRWIKEDGTIIQPGVFVPIAESCHLINKISDFVVYEACRQNKMWQDMGLPKIIMSINFTSNDFYRKDIREMVFDALIKSGLSSEWLEIELTESLALKDIDTAIKQMQSLRQMGIRLAMDDFGTGYSSLSYIQVLPITLLKLDRSFIIDLETDQIAKEIVSAVIRIAKSKKIETLAEGIETAGQVKILRAEGCDYAQGYLYGKPMPADKIVDFIRNNFNLEV